MTASNKFVHDMRNQIGIVLGYSASLLDEMAADDPRRADVDEIKKAGEAALALLDRWKSSAGESEPPTAR